MPSRHLIDPELASMIDPARPQIVWSAEVLPLVRAAYREMILAALPPCRNDVILESRTIPGPDGAPELGVLIARPGKAGAGRPAILHIHGGGYVIGSAEINRATLETYAANLDAVVVSVDYRLAPETPHPGPVEDCYAALAYIHAQAEALGIDTARIAVSGESAGGGLAACMALLARDRAVYQIAFQHLVFPMLDDRTVTRKDPSPFLGEFIWTPDANRFGWASLLGQEPGGPDISPYAAAARASDLSGLPPTFIACGALDLFIEENLDYSRRLIRAGIPTEAHIYPGAPHGFMMVESAAVTRQFARDSLFALVRALT